MEEKKTSRNDSHDKETLDGPTEIKKTKTIGSITDQNTISRYHIITLHI